MLDNKSLLNQINMGKKRQKIKKLKRKIKKLEAQVKAQQKLLADRPSKNTSTKINSNSSGQNTFRHQALLRDNECSGRLSDRHDD